MEGGEMSDEEAVERWRMVHLEARFIYFESK